MSQQELLSRVVRVLDEQGVPYMVTGSVVSSLQGEPRATHDADIVVALSPSADAIGRLLAAFPAPDFYLSEPAIREALRTGGMFNLLDTREGDKVDFWMLTADPFDASRFARRYPQRIGDQEMMVSRPEDTILMKLRWTNVSGGSQKQFADALHVYELQAPKLDHAYLERWAAALGVGALWARVKQEAETE